MFSIYSKYINIIFLSSFLSACGFAPLYSLNQGSGSLSTRLQTIKLPIPKNYTQKLVINELTKITNPLINNHIYDLKLYFKESINDTLNEQDSDVTIRSSYNLHIKYTLNDSKNNIISKGQSYNKTSFNENENEFLSFQSINEAKARVAKITAEEIAQELAIILHNIGSEDK